jgi:membrane protease YdiL (CAAX protease family)
MRLRPIFLTPDGRPALVWRLLGYTVLFGLWLALRRPLESASQRALGGIEIGPWRLLITQLVTVSLVVTLTIGTTFVFRRFVDRRDWRGMAIPPPWVKWRDLLAGFAIGAVMILAVLAVELGFGWIRIAGVKEGFTPVTLAAVATARFIHFIGTAVCEEVAYRGYLLQNVGERFSVWVALLTTGALFALSHFAAIGFGSGFVIAGILCSFFLGQMRLATKAIWLGVGWHLSWDWVQDTAGMVPGYSPLVTQREGPALWTGGGMAIEGGLLSIIVLAVGLAVLHAWIRATGRAIDWRAPLDFDGAVRTAVDKNLAIANAGKNHPSEPESRNG